jgi:hypothetical protein
MSKFKVRCIKSWDNRFTVGRIYTADKNGYITDNHGNKYPVRGNDFKEWYIKCGWINYDFEEIKDYNTNKIVITSDGYTTTAKLYDGKTVVKSAEAKCHPDGTFDFAIGANLAYDRLMRSDRACEVSKEEPIKLYCVKEPEISWVRESLTKGKIYEFDGHRIEYDNGSSAWFTDFKAWKHGDPNYAACLVPLVKRPAKVGEWVYICDATSTHGAYRNGNIRFVEDVLCSGGKTFGVYFATGKTTNENKYSNKGFSFASNNEYLVLDGYKSETEYYNGKVVCVKSSNNDFTAGKIYEFRDGQIIDNDGCARPTNDKATLDDDFWSEMGCKFIEFKGEVTND